MVLTVLATPITVNAVSDNNDAQAAQVKETAKKQAVTTTKQAATTAKQNTTNKQITTKQSTTTTKQATTSKAAAKKVGWTQVGNTWYYYNAQGQQVKNAWVGSYWLGSDGKMATNTWVDGGKYYVGSQGWWVKDAKKTAQTAKSTTTTKSTTAAKKSGWSKVGNTWYYYDAKEIK